jgi:ASCH domain
MTKLLTAPKRGLIIKEHWLNHILEGRKTWEIRGSNTTIREEIALIQSGTGKIMGKAKLVECKELTFEEYQASEEFHAIPNDLTKHSPYKKIYAWILEDATRLIEPIPYQHPQGAVIWVNLHSTRR